MVYLKTLGADLTKVRVVSYGTLTLRYKGDINQAYAIVPRTSIATKAMLHLNNASDTLSNIYLYLDDMLSPGTRTLGANFPGGPLSGQSPGYCGYSAFYYMAYRADEIADDNAIQSATDNGLAATDPADASYCAQYDMGDVKTGYLALFKACLYDNEIVKLYGSNDLSTLTHIASLTGITAGTYDGYAYLSTSPISYRYILLYPHDPENARDLFFGQIGFFQLLIQPPSIAAETGWYTTKPFKQKGNLRSFIIGTPAGAADCTIDYFWLEYTG